MKLQRMTDKRIRELLESMSDESENGAALSSSGIQVVCARLFFELFERLKELSESASAPALPPSALLDKYLSDRGFKRRD